MEQDRTPVLVNLYRIKKIHIYYFVVTLTHCYLFKYLFKPVTDLLYDSFIDMPHVE